MTAPPAVDYYCHQFRPNTFDPSRCSACLRPDHMHLSTNIITAAGQDRAHEWDEDDDGDDNHALSEVTSNASSDDISGGWTYEWSLVHSLSPEWELNICDPDIQPSSPNHSGSPDRSRSLSAGRNSGAHRDMTRLDPSPQHLTGSSLMDERRGRDRSRRPSSDTRGNREQESGYFSPDRRGESRWQMEEVNKRQYRYYERGHPLPSNYIPEPKACVPYRNVNLGVPSQRRNEDTFIQECWRSESPERYTYHSNFRRGDGSERNSPTRHSSVSPDRYKLIEPPVVTQRRGSLSRSQARSHSTSHGSSQLPSRGPSRQTSGQTSPSRRRESVISQTVSPSRATSSHRLSNSTHLQNGDFEVQRGYSRDSRSPSQASNKHSLDSERLYRNLESLSRRGSSTIQKNSHEGSQASPRTRTAINSSANSLSHNSREVSPPRNGYSTQSKLSPSQGSWQGSSHSFLSLPPSRGSSSSRHQLRGVDSQMLGGSLSPVSPTETDKYNKGNVNTGGDRSRSTVRRGMDALLISEPKKEAVEVEEVGMTMEDYIILANIPTIHLESEEELPGLRRRNQSPSPCRDRTYRYQDETDIYGLRFESDDRGRGRERGRDRREKHRDSENVQRSSRGPSTAPLHAQNSDYQSGKSRSSRSREQSSLGCPQTQVLLLKGWMSRLDEHGEWRKHWFVLGDTSLRYYRDSEAEESDDLDGEIDIASCVNVSDCDVEKNYGLQIQTKRAVFTLSAITSRIRRNWVKLLKQAIQNNRHQSDNSSEKENPPIQRASPCQRLAQFTCEDSGYEHTTATYTRTAANSHQDNLHGPQTDGDGDQDVDFSPATQREEGEGWDREQAKRLEERNKWFEEGVPLGEMGSRWDSVELKSGSVPVPVIESMDSEVSRKWAEFETLSFGDMSAQSLIGAKTSQSSIPQESKTVDIPKTNQTSQEDIKQSESDLSRVSINGAQTNTAEALQKEALTLRKQVESIKRERAALGIEVDSPCGPGAPCRAKLEAMEVAHRKTLQELQEKHMKEIRELEEQKDRMLQEERRAASKAMEDMKTSHRAELEKANRLGGRAAHMETSSKDHVPQANILHSELDTLSEKYSQTCLQLSHTEQSSKSRETELGCKERELEQLRRENQELKAKLAEEISRMRYFITGQRSDAATLANTERSAADVELLLRAKDNEVQYLKKEISCLQNEVQSLTKERDAACERYKKAYVELSDLRGNTELEKGSLNQHLRLTNAALQEGGRNT